MIFVKFMKQLPSQNPEMVPGQPIAGRGQGECLGPYWGGESYLRAGCFLFTAHWDEWETYFFHNKTTNWMVSSRIFHVDYVVKINKTC